MPARRPSAVALAAAALALAPACGGDEDAAEASGPPSTVQEGPVAATAVAAGDCLNGVVLGAAERREITTAQVVSCDRAHALEVFATFELDGADFEVGDPGAYPGRARVVRAADEGCGERIAELLDDPGVYGLIALWPSEASWATGDRAVACAVFSRDGTPFDRRQL